MTDQEAVIRAAEKLSVTFEFQFGVRYFYIGNNSFAPDNKNLHRLLALEICERDNADLLFYSDAANAFMSFADMIDYPKQDIYMAIIRKYAEDK